MDVINSTDLAKIACSYDFMLIGELHGSSQNAQLIGQIAKPLVENNKSFSIAFEWPLSSKELIDLQTYTYGGELPETLSDSFIDSDGRFTYEHITLLKWIRKSNIKKKHSIFITTFDSIDTEKIDRERHMTEKLISYKKHFSHPIIVETGTLHARKKEYLFDSNVVNPMGAQLSSKFKTCAVFLHYIRGKICVEGHEYNVKEAYTQHEGPSIFFDYTLEIQKSDMALSPKNLTEIVDLLK